MREGTYIFKGIEILDAVRTNGLDSHRLSVHRQLASAGCPPWSGGSVVNFSEATVRDPVALRQKATLGGDFLKPI